MHVYMSEILRSELQSLDLEMSFGILKSNGLFEGTLIY